MGVDLTLRLDGAFGGTTFCSAFFGAVIDLVIVFWLLAMALVVGIVMKRSDLADHSIQDEV